LDASFSVPSISGAQLANKPFRNPAEPAVLGVSRSQPTPSITKWDVEKIPEQSNTRACQKAVNEWNLGLSTVSRKMSSTPVKSGTPTVHKPAEWRHPDCSTSLKNSRNPCSTLSFEEASDPILCIPMIKAAVAREHRMNEFASNVEPHRREL